jgi:hypothetical protein
MALERYYRLSDTEVTEIREYFMRYLYEIFSGRSVCRLWERHA